MSHRTDLSALTVVITGAARGIGAATARQLRDAGARVIISDRDAELLATTAGALGVDSYPLDVTDPEQWAGLVAFAGGVDVLVNNAGIMPVGRFLEESPGTTRAVFEVARRTPPRSTRSSASPRRCARRSGRWASTSPWCCP